MLARVPKVVITIRSIAVAHHAPPSSRAARAAARAARAAFGSAIPPPDAWLCSARLPLSLGLSPSTALALQHHDDGVSHLLGHILYGFAFGARTLPARAGGGACGCAAPALRPRAPGGGALVYLLA